jgi:hypothetical protein
MDDKGMPDTAEDRVKIARSILDRVKRDGFDPKNLYFDPLIRPISTEPAQAGEFLRSIPMIKDLGANKSVYQDYGWKNTGTLFKQHLLSYGIEFLKEELDVQTDVEGNVTNITYGVERIPDPMLLREMNAYQDGVNVDRLVTFCALVAFAKVQQSNRGLQKRVIVENDKLENSQNFSKLSMRSPFRHLGNSTSNVNGMNKPRSAFKNFR